MKATLAPPAGSPELRAARQRSLGAFFAPRTIALIGASAEQGSVGRALLENLFEFDGRVFPVNPRHASLLRIPAFARVGDLPQPAELAVIATPAATVPGIVRECAQAGVKAAIICSAGFRECGPAGAELEQQVLTEARSGGLRVIGPNCLGLMAPHLRLNATFATTLARPGSVAFISQSGALCTAVLDWSLRENVGLSAMVSVGSMLDVGWGDLITSLGDDPHTRSILLYMESIGDARSFLSAAREVAFSKPIIVVKAGRTEGGAHAAASHTGALTGSDAVVDAAFRRVGVLRVDSIEDLFDMAEVLGKQPRPAGPRLGIVTNAGGPAALAVDRLVLGGGQIASLSEKTREQLNHALPAQWSHGNPVDVLGDADEKRYGKAVELVASDPGTDGVLVILTPQAMTDALATAERIKDAVPRGAGKPLLASWMGATAVEAGESVLNDAGVPTFKFPDRASQAFNYMWRYSANLASLYETPALRVRAADGAGFHSDIEPRIAEARRQGRLLLTEQESKEILSAYGIPVVETFPAGSEEEAVNLAVKTGFPVAVKLHSQTITHKAEVGGVRLNVRNVAETREAWRSIRQAVAEKVGESHFLGVSVQRMLPSAGFELIVGSSVDPQFGPVLLFGAGGRLVEVIQDRAIGLPPLNSTLARRLMERTRIHAAFKDWHGKPAIDVAVLEDVLVRFSQLVAQLRAIKEIDINPLLVSADQIVALDARIVLHDAGVADERLPRLAIRPYPEHYATTCTLADGAPILLRSIRPEDEPLMVRFHEGLSDQSVYFRYFTHLSLEQRTNHARLARLCFIDYDREVAVVAVHHDRSSGASAIIGVARLCKAHGSGPAEFAVVVSDRWQRRRVGTMLLRKLVEIGRDEGLSGIRGVILGDNTGMRRLCERVGFRIRQHAGESEWEASITL
jgi:acetyltransferase